MKIDYPRMSLNFVVVLCPKCHTKPVRGYFLTIAEFHVGRE